MKFLARMLGRRPTPSRAYAIFIDHPNVENASLDSLGVPLSVNWEILTEVILGRLAKAGVEKKLWAGVYARVPYMILDDAEAWWAKKGFVLRTPFKQKRDIDSLIGIKILDVAAEAHASGITELHIVVVSGDHVFAEAVETIRSRYPSMTVVFTVYSWINSLSNLLIETAGLNNVYPLNTIRNLVPDESLQAMTRTKEPAPP